MIKKLSLPGRTPKVITLWGNPILRTAATPITVFDKSVESLIDQLFDTMYSIEVGVGLAANQIGRSESAFVFDCRDGVIGHVINPVIERIGMDFQSGPEGCLSLPGFDLDTVRFDRCRVRGQDKNGNDVVYEGEGLRSRCFQHEADHLAGKLYIDHQDDEIKTDIEATMTETGWHGHDSLDPTSSLYVRCQMGLDEDE